MTDHAPITTVLRGQPAHVVAKVTAQKGATIVSVDTYVRLADVGNPIKYIMSGGPGDGTYDSEVPVSLIRAVQRFWYYVHVVDSAGRISDTAWYPVNVVDGAGDGGAAGGGRVFTKKNALIAGVLLLGGGAAAIIDHNSDGGGNDPTPPPAPPAPVVNPPKESNSKDNNDADPTPPVCVTTGSERVAYDALSLDPFDPGTPIKVFVCGACSNAAIRVVGSWGQETTASPYNNPNCDPGNLILLAKPSLVPSPDSETIQVFSNGVLIDTIPWPNASFANGR